MKMRELVEKNRSVRRFRQAASIDLETLEGLVDLARLCASARNRQPLKYILSCSQATNAVIFENLVWARDLPDWPGPAQGERPSAYIILLQDRSVATQVHCDHGIAAQTILLAAVERGFNGCILASVRRDRLGQQLAIPPRYEILLVLALGVAAETCLIEPMVPGDDPKYWRDADGVHHVPKRSLEEIIIARHA